MAKNRIRGKPKRKTNRVRDSDIEKKIKKDIESLMKKGIKYIDKNKKKLIPYIAFACIGDKLSYLYRTSDATNLLGRLNDTISSLNDILCFPLLSLNVRDILSYLNT